MPPELQVSQPSNTEIPPSSNLKGRLKLVVLIIIVVLVLGGLGYAAAQLLITPSKPQATPTPSTAPPVTADERSKLSDSKIVTQLIVTTLTADSAEIKALKVSGGLTVQGNLTVGGSGAFAGNVTAANFQGGGAGLTNVNAALLNGQPGSYYANLASGNASAVAALQANAALRNAPNTFTAANTFNAGVTASSLSLGTPLSLASGGLGLTSVGAQGILYGQSGGTLGVATPAGSGLCLLSGPTDVTWGACSGGSSVTSLDSLTGALTVANSTGLGSTITINNAAADGATKGIAAFNATNFLAASGVINTAQDINAGATPTFAGVNTNALTPSAALTIGAVGQALTMQGSATSITANSGGNATTVNFQAPTANVTYRFLTAAAGTYDICTSAGNCAGSGGVTSLNTLTGALTVANATTAGSTITINDATTAAKGIASFNSTNFSVTAGAVNTIQNIDVTASPTFAGINTNSLTPSGALTVGSTTQSLTLQGSNTTLTRTNGANVAALTFVAPTANVTYQLQTAAAGTYDVCTTAGNCVGVGGSVSTSGGSANTIPKYTSATAIGPSLLTDNGALVTVGGNLSVTGSVTLTTALTVGNGGTGATTAPGARTNLGAAASGPNSDITSLSGLTTALSVVQGGTGAISLTANGVLLGNGTSPISAITGSNGECLVVVAGAPTFQSCPGGGGVSSLNTLTGGLTIANASTGGSTITINNAAADGATKGIAAFNATNFSAASGIINTAQNINAAATPTFAGITSTGTAAVQGASLTIGTASSTSGALVLQNATNAFTLALNAPSQTVGSATVSFPNTGGANDTVCLLTLSNCVGTGGGVSGSGTADRLAKFTSTGSVVGDSTISDNGSTVTTTGDLVVQGGDATFGTTSQIASLIMHDGNGQTTTLQAGNSAGNLTFILPTVAGAANQCLKQSGAGNQLIWDACDGGGGGSSATLQTAYVNGNSISTTGNNIAFTLNSSQNLTVTTAAGATGSTTYALADGANASPAAQLVLVTNNDTNQAVANGITIAAAAGGLTNGLNVSDPDITNAVNVGDNTILGTLAVIDFTNFDVDASGNATLGGSLTLGTALSTGNGGTGATTTQGAINNLSQLTTNGDLLYNNGTNSTRLARGANGDCLTSSATTVLWGSCAGTADSISVNSVAATNANFIDTTATGTTAGVAWGLNTGPAPDDISLTVSSASASQAGVVTNVAQTFAGDKTFTGNIIAGSTTTLADHNLTSTGALTVASGGSADLILQAAGAVDIGQSGGTAINIGTNAGVHTIGIGTGAADNDVTIGSTTAGSSLILNSAGTITLGASTLQHTAAGTTTIDLLDSATTTLSVTNSNGGQVANLSVEGSLTLGSALTTGNGGTGSATTQGAINNLSQLTTEGDLLFRNATNSTRLARGANGECLTSSTTTILWASCGGAGTTLQGAYDADANGSDSIIALTANDDSIILRNPASSGSDSTYILTVEQLNTSATGCTGSVCGGLDIQSAGTGNLFRVRDTTATAIDVLTIADGGASTFRNQTDSTAAFNVQNSAGSSLLAIDSSSSNINLLGNSTSTLSTWTTTTAMSVSSGGSTNRVRGGAVVANGYLYHIGGAVDNSATTVATVQYAKLNADGTVGTWSSTTALPNPRKQFQPVVVNGYLYVIGGTDNSGTIQSTAYYAKLNADGTVGAWNATTALTSGGAARFGQGTVTYNGYIYVLGGNNSTPAATNTVYYAKVGADGTLATSWSTTTTMNDSLASINGSTVANGYIYVPGGFSQTTGTVTDVEYAKLNTDGTVGSWTTQGAILPGSGEDNLLSFVGNGYLYIVGGDNAWSTPRVESHALNANGSIGSATTLTNFPGGQVGEGAMAQANGYFYVLGGSSAHNGTGTVTSAVYYASTPRVKVGGNLDLVGYSGKTLAEDGASGQLTAGNTIVTGTLQVSDAANFTRSVAIGDTLHVEGAAAINGSLTIGTSDTTASLLTVDTKTSSGEPAAPPNGAIYYNTGGNGGASGAAVGAGKFRCYEGNIWKNCVGMRDIAERRWGYLTYNGNVTTAPTPVGGIEAPTINGSVAADANAESYYNNYPSTATINSIGGFTTTAFATTQAQYKPKLVTRIRMDGSSITNSRIWVALNSSAITGTAPSTSPVALGSPQYIGVAYDSAVNSGKFTCGAGNGTSHQDVDTGVTPAAGDYLDVIVDLSTPGFLVCSIARNGGAYTTVTTSAFVPSGSTSFGYTVATTATAGSAARKMDIAYLFLEYQ